MPATARAGLSQSQKLGTTIGISHTSGERGQVLEASSDTLHDTLTGSWTGSGARTQAGAPNGVSVSQGVAKLACYNAGLLFYD